MGRLGLNQGEIIQISRILHDMFLQDKSDFTGFSTRFGDPFAANFLAAINNGAGLPTVHATNAEVKAVTKRIHLKMNVFRADLTQLSALIGLTTDSLTIAKEDFGIKNVREALVGFKVPEFMSSMHNLMNNVKANLVPLTAVGLPATFVANIETRVMQVSADDVLQRKMVSRRKQDVQDNAIQYGVIQSMMALVMDSGKAIYKVSNPAKAKSYTLTELKRKHKVSQNPPTPPPAE